MATQEKPRKRIVPQLIVASPTKLPDAYDGLPPPSPQLQVTDLREQAEFAKEHLGLDRKIYVDLRPYQESNKAVNWKQLLKERGAKPAGKVPRGGPGGEPGAEMDLMSRGHNPRQAANPLLRVLRRLEQTYCTRNESDEDSDNSQEEDDDSSGSDMDDEGGSGGNATDGGGRTDAEAAGPDGLPLPRKKKRADKAPAGGDDYDHADDWIDDEEFIEMIERSDKRKTKFEGFFITRGEIERTEEMLPGFSPEKARKPAAAPKRKPAEGGGFDSGSDFQAAPLPKPRPAVKEGGEGGEKKAAKRKAEGEGEEPAKKKKKKVVPEAIVGAAPAPPGQAQAAAPPAAPKMPSMAQQAAAFGAMAGAGFLRAPGASVSPDHRLHAPAAALPPTPADRPASSMPPPPPSAKRANSEPYELRPEVASAISALRQVADETKRQLPAEAPALAQGEEAATRRKIPPAVKAALGTFSAIYCRETEGNSNAARLLLDELEPFLAPFCSRQTLSTTLRKTASKSNKPAPRMTLEGLKGLLAGIAPPPPPMPTAAAAAGNSDDDFQQPSTQALASEQQQPAEGGAAAPPASAAAGPAAGKDSKPAPAYTHVPAALRKEVYQHMHALLGGKQIKSADAVPIIQAVVNAFPAGVITVAGVKKIYSLEKAKGNAAAKAAAAAGQPQPATSQQPGQPKKAGSRQPSRAPSPALTTTSPEAQQYAQAAALAAQVKLKLAPAPEAVAVQPAVPAGQPAAGPAAPAAHPAASTATAGVNAAAVAEEVATEALVPLMGDEEVVQAGAQLGAQAEALRGVLASAKQNKGQYAGGLVRALMLAGPGGFRLAEIVAKVHELRFAAGWDVKGTMLSRVASGMDYVARLGTGRYALRAFPGVVHVPVPEKPAKVASAGPEEAAGGSAGVGGQQAPAERPAAGLPVAVPAAGQEAPAQGEGSA